MLDLITGPIGALIGGLVAILAPFVTLWLGKRQGRSQGKNEAQQEQRKQELQSHDRINQADTGVGATDDERMRELQRLGQEWERD